MARPSGHEKHFRSTRARWLLLALFVVALGTRLGHLTVHYARHGAEIDNRDYEAGAIAGNLVAGRGFSRDGVRPSAHKPPIYPAVLAASRRLFPERPYLAMRILQALAVALACTLALAPFRRVVGERRALAAIALLLVSPFLLKAHVQIEGMAFSMLGIIVVLRLVMAAAERPERVPPFVALGVACGLLALSLSATLALVPVVLGWLAVTLARPWRWRRPVLVLALVVVTILPWAVRNAAAFGRLTPVSSNLGLELWIGSNPRATGAMHDAAMRPVTAPDGELAARLEGLDEVERNRVLGREAFRWARSNPGSWLELRARSLFYFLCTHLYWIEPGPASWRLQVSRALVLAMNLLAALGAVRLVRARAPYAVLVVGLIAAFTAVYTLTHADIVDRYRLPIDPLLLLLAVAGVAGPQRNGRA